MKHEFQARPLTHAAGFTIVVLGLAAGAARAGQPWTYSIAVGTSVRYQYRLDTHDFGSYPASFGPGYLVWSELAGLFEGAGWRLEVNGWPGRLREMARDAVERARWGRRTARFPVLVGRRDG